MRKRPTMETLILTGFRESEKLHVLRRERFPGRPVCLCGHFPPLWVPSVSVIASEAEDGEACKRCLSLAGVKE